MRRVWLIAILALRCSGYELTGRIEPPTAVTVSLHGTAAPFEISTVSGADGRFRFRKVPAGTYSLAVWTAARGEAVETVELTPGTVNAHGNRDIVFRIDGGRLESDGVRVDGVTVPAVALSIPDRAMREYRDAQACLSRRESDCATVHLKRAVGIAPQFAAAWNQLGTIAYQMSRYSDAETNFRKALDADPEAFEPLVNLGGVLLNLDRAREAIGYNQRAVAVRPNDALANSQLGLSYFFVNDLDAAEKHLKIAIRLDPGQFSHPQLALAEIYIKRGDRASALGALRDFLARHPDAPQAAKVRREIDELNK